MKLDYKEIMKKLTFENKSVGGNLKLIRRIKKSFSHYVQLPDTYELLF